MPADDSKRTPCEIYSRVVGYLRPVGQWNDGKQAEYYDRKTFIIKPEEANRPALNGSR